MYSIDYQSNPKGRWISIDSYHLKVNARSAYKLYLIDLIEQRDMDPSLYCRIRLVKRGLCCSKVIEMEPKPSILSSDATRTRRGQG